MAGRPRSRARRDLLLALALLLVAGFAALGVWQLQRRVGKLALIERVEQRVHAPPGAAPARSDWPTLSAQRDEYRRVQLEGTWLAGHAALVQAATALGQGYWVLTPLQSAQGGIILVNRGFVPQEQRAAAQREAGLPAGPVRVVGLLRLSEPRGTLLRDNDPAAQRWVSRDVAAIGAARGLAGVAPYFVDAEADPAAGAAPGVPVGGLTVIAFPNDHLQYALTWFALAALLGGALAVQLRTGAAPADAGGAP